MRECAGLRTWGDLGSTVGRLKRRKRGMEEAEAQRERERERETVVCGGGGGGGGQVRVVLFGREGGTRFANDVNCLSLSLSLFRGVVGPE